MQNTPSNKELNKLSSTPLDHSVFIPIIPDWRTLYYKRVLEKRMLAYIFDSIIIFAITFVLFLILTLIFNRILPPEQLTIFYNLQLIVVSSAIPVLVSILESSKWKGAFGKRIMKIEVSDNFGNPISFWKSIWRNILKGITFYICLTVIGYFIQKYYYLKTGKLIHDHWSNTVIGERLDT